MKTNEAIDRVDWTPPKTFHCQQTDRALLNWLKKRGIAADYQEQRDQRLRKMEEILAEVKEV